MTALVPGKYHAGRKGCHFPWDGLEHSVTANFEVLMNNNSTLQWVITSHSVPVNAVEGGKTLGKEPLYVIRCQYTKDSETVGIPGWFQQSAGPYVGHASKKLRCGENKWEFLTCV